MTCDLFRPWTKFRSTATVKRRWAASTRCGPSRMSAATSCILLRPLASVFSLLCLLKPYCPRRAPVPKPLAELAPTYCPTMELDPPAPSTNSTDETMVFSSTMMPQSVHTDEPDGPSDSMLREPQLGHIAAALPGAACLPAPEGDGPGGPPDSGDGPPAPTAASAEPWWPPEPEASSPGPASSQKLGSKLSHSDIVREKSARLIVDLLRSGWQLVHAFSGDGVFFEVHNYPIGRRGERVKV
mmetsp:Transcript_36100/g.82414  ORF Transcript_36100/g.82414 Transcript_36100/m.82414 type:complete len:241 (-) Transcript_36100:128-850(-)